MEVTEDFKNYLVFFVELAGQNYITYLAKSPEHAIEQAKEQFPKQAVYSIFEIGDLVYHINGPVTQRQSG